MITQKVTMMKHCYNYEEAREIVGEYDDEIDYVGPKDSILTKAIPRKFYGIDVNFAAYTHDIEYVRGGTDKDKVNADVEFLSFMLHLIEEHTYPRGLNWVVKWLARRAAVTYYEAVSLAGRKNFCYV